MRLANMALFEPTALASHNALGLTVPAITGDLEYATDLPCRLLSPGNRLAESILPALL